MGLGATIVVQQCSSDEFAGDPKHFIDEAFKHCKPIATIGEGVELLMASDIMGIKFEQSSGGELTVDARVVTLKSADNLGAFNAAFIEAIA